MNEFAYCPRLFHLEWVQAQWAESDDTAEGNHEHRAVDRPGGAAPLPDEGEVRAARSLQLSSIALGLVAKIDRERLEMRKYCRFDRRHTVHKETR